MNGRGSTPVDLHARVTGKLLAHGVKPTAQRLEIGMLMLDRPCHYSADDLLRELRRAGSRVSKATVYNTLNLFARHGILRTVAVDPNRLVYDSTTRPHHHFYNADTGELTDISASDVRLPRLPQLPRGTEAESAELVIRVRRRRD